MVLDLIYISRWHTETVVSSMTTLHYGPSKQKMFNHASVQHFHCPDIKSSPSTTIMQTACLRKSFAECWHWNTFNDNNKCAPILVLKNTNFLFPMTRKHSAYRKSSHTVNQQQLFSFFSGQVALLFSKVNNKRYHQMLIAMYLSGSFASLL